MDYFQITVAGSATGNDEEIRMFSGKVTSLLTEVSMRLGDNSFHSGPEQIRLLAHDGLSDLFWDDIASINQLEIAHLSDNEQSVLADPLRRVNSYNQLLSQADLLILLWNESFSGDEGIMWDLIQKSHEMNIPCLWVSKKKPYKAYWTEFGYFEEYKSEYLKKYCDSYFFEEGIPYTEKKIPFLSLGEKLYARFMKKFRASDIPGSYEKDRMLDAEFFMQDNSSESVRKSLLGSFSTFDNSAIKNASKYRASIYFRSILPFIATAFIAVGFYSETLFGFAVNPEIGGISLWLVVAGIGFLLHAGVNFYAFCLAKNNQIKRWHRNFLQNRILAEFLRVYIHICPFGYTMNPRTLMRKCGLDVSESSEILFRLRHALHETDPSGIAATESSRKECLSSLRLLVEDQILYHKKSVHRYEKIVEHLAKMGKYIFTAGFVIVLMRGVLQFSIFTFDIGISRNGIALKSFIRSAANFLALFVPAWASYYTSKLSLCEFDFMKQNDEDMVLRLEKCVEILDTFKDRDISEDVFNSVVEQVAVLMLSEVSDWRNEIAKKVITTI
ncbi:MAG: hypothetical protein LUG64_02060 [Clostridiales bacterium]|nr:hypothetical protein [Clostridiales bacterium]